MKIKTAYRLGVCRKLHAFGDSLEDVPVCGVPLRRWQNEPFESRGIAVKDIEDVSQAADEHSILFDNNLFFTKQFLGAALDRAEHSGRPLRFCLADNTFNRQFVLPFDPADGGRRAFNFFYHVRDGGARATYEDAILPQRLHPFGVRLPRELVRDPDLHFDLCDTFAAAFISPFHVLAASLAMLGHRLVPLARAFPERLGRALAPQGSRLFYWLLRRKNRIGRRCRIHPTAVVEGSVIGDDVTLGAYSVVRVSRIGDGSTVEDHASVHYSVLGKNNWISAHDHVLQCLSYDEVFLIHGPYQFSVFGRNCCVFATINCDVRLDKKTITIPTDRGILDSGRSLLGVAYGHDTKVAGGTIVAPGRIVPNGRRIDPPASIILDPGAR